MIRVIFLKILLCSHSFFQSPVLCHPISYGSGRIGRAICSVRTTAQNDDILQAIDINGCGQDEFLIPSSEPFSAYGDGGFASGDDAGRPGNRIPCLEYLFSDSRMNSSHFLCFSFDEGGKDQTFISKFFSFSLRGLDG
jgi:hypothetical protein